MDTLNIYYKKTVALNFRGKDLSFRASQSLFSSFDIDLGTKHLLQTLSNEGFNTYNKVLDLGCGYGVIGIALKSFCESAVVHMVDRDALALDFSRQNAQLNGLKEMSVYASLGYDEVSESDFDLIVSNIPAKVGEPVLAHMLEDARFYLRPKGKVAVVVIDAIGDYVTKVLESNKDINILFQKRWPGHLVFHYEFKSEVSGELKPKQTAFENGIYKRGQTEVKIGDLQVSIETAYGLPEFDILSYETEMLLEKLAAFKNKQINKALVFNPGQGFLPAVLSKLGKVEEIKLADRDLEALKVSRDNLVANGFDSKRTVLIHAADFSIVKPDSIDLELGILDDKEESKVHQAVIKELAEKLSPGGEIIISSGSTPITRIESWIRKEKLLAIAERRKTKGKSLIVLKRKI